MTRKAKQQPKEQQEARQEPRQQEQQQQPKEQQPKKQPKKPKPTPIVKRITYEVFEKFDPKPGKKSWIKEVLEIAVKEPIMVRNMNRGQVMALINQIDRHNMTSDNKIAYKYNIKQGIVLLAPKKAITKMEGEKK
jgi:sRNA-binding protein